MTDATTDILRGDLAPAGTSRRWRERQEPSGFELSNGKRTARWLVTIEKGDVSVSQARRAKADCVVRSDRGALRSVGNRTR